jgi:hypothetical protein
MKSGGEYYIIQHLASHLMIKWIKDWFECFEKKSGLSRIECGSSLGSFLCRAEGMNGRRNVHGDEGRSG